MNLQSIEESKCRGFHGHAYGKPFEEPGKCAWGLRYWKSYLKVQAVRWGTFQNGTMGAF